MTHPVNRRQFVKSTAIGSATLAAGAMSTITSADHHEKDDKAGHGAAAHHHEGPLFRISLAEWSLHKTIHGGQMTNLDFPAVAKNEFDIDAVEYVNQFFKDKAQDTRYLSELKSRCDDLGVRSLLIMCDGEGQLGDANQAARTKAVENHYKWVEAANLIGCHSIRVNAASSGTREEQRDRAADGLAQLGEFADQHGMNVLVENHGGLSSDGAWLAAVMQQVARPNVGTLPDFGNFKVSENVMYDRYRGMKELMPYAMAVSAKSHNFDAEGNETNTDYRKVMNIVLDHDYHGYVGIEWEGGVPDEKAGIRLTRDLLLRVREELS